ncbi:basic salivary proline-rich protein 1-like [Passer montanus]|uniref:basic salivary proline-rich protein 1-like n=1 Tax=Passer montanus TaxID=9160 RepID=UPI0019620F3E|nr:basic salivary proline-rich protein 1-like [Passer montanus]
MRHWNRLPREAVPSLEVINAGLDEAFSNLMQWKVSLPVSGGLQLGPSRRRRTQGDGHDQLTPVRRCCSPSSPVPSLGRDSGDSTSPRPLRGSPVGEEVGEGGNSPEMPRYRPARRTANPGGAAERTCGRCLHRVPASPHPSGRRRTWQRSGAEPAPPPGEGRSPLRAPRPPKGARRRRLRGALCDGGGPPALLRRGAAGPGPGGGGSSSSVERGLPPSPR